MGTTTKLTRKLIERAVELKKRHLPVSRIAMSLGITRDTWYRWLREGESAHTGLQRQFYLRIHEAQAEEQLELLGCIRGAADKGTWGAATWILERQYPKDWGKRDGDHEPPTERGPFEVIVEVPESAVIRPAEPTDDAMPPVALGSETGTPVCG